MSSTLKYFTRFADNNADLTRRLIRLYEKYKSVRGASQSHLKAISIVQNHLKIIEKYGRRIGNAGIAREYCEMATQWNAFVDIMAEFYVTHYIYPKCKTPTNIDSARAIKVIKDMDRFAEEIISDAEKVYVRIAIIYNNIKADMASAANTVIIAAEKSSASVMPAKRYVAAGVTAASATTNTTAAAASDLNTKRQHILEMANKCLFYLRSDDCRAEIIRGIIIDTQKYAADKYTPEEYERAITIYYKNMTKIHSDMKVQYTVDDGIILIHD
jgi:hypothetical protein